MSSAIKIKPWSIRGPIDGEYTLLEAYPFQYVANTRPAIMLYAPDENGVLEPYADLTINLVDVELKQLNHVIINPDLHADVAELCISAGLLRPGVLDKHQVGNTVAKVYRLTERAAGWLQLF